MPLTNSQSVRLRSVRMLGVQMWWLFTLTPLFNQHDASMPVDFRTTVPTAWAMQQMCKVLSTPSATQDHKCTSVYTTRSWETHDVSQRRICPTGRWAWTLWCSTHCWACHPFHWDTNSVSSLVVKVSTLIHLYPVRDILGQAVLNFLSRFTRREASMASAFNPGHLSLVGFTCKLGSSWTAMTRFMWEPGLPFSW